MSTLDQCGTTARRALWFGGLLILLAGVIGMHGMNSHAGGLAPDVHAIVLHHPEAATAPAHSPVAKVHDVVTTAIHEVAGPLAAAGAAIADGESGMDAGMAEMCMAVLGLALTVLLRKLGNITTLPLYRLVSAPTRAPGFQGRDPDPPSLINLSIRRC